MDNVKYAHVHVSEAERLLMMAVHSWPGLPMSSDPENWLDEHVAKAKVEIRKALALLGD